MSAENKKKLTTIYKEIMIALGFEVDSKMHVLLNEAGVKTPFTIKGKQLIIPTDEWLKNPDYDNQIPFHPLSENVRRKKSEVQERLALAVSNRVYRVTCTLLNFIFTLALDTDKHPQLTPEQREYLRDVPDVTKKTLTAVQKLIQEKVDFKGQYALVNMFVKRSGLWKGEEYPRVCTTTFPIMDEEHSPEKKIFDVPFLVRDRSTFFKVMRRIFPNIDTSMDDYSYGSRSQVAPNFHSLMMAFSLLANDLNKVTKVFCEDFAELEGCIIQTNWVKNMADLNDYKNDIPPLDGNIGEANEDELAEMKSRQEEKVKREERRTLRREVSAGRQSILRPRDEGNRFVRQEESREDERTVSWRGRAGRDDDRGYGREDRYRSRRDDRYDDRDRGRDSRYRDERDDRGFGRRDDRYSREDRFSRDDRRDTRGGNDDSWFDNVSTRRRW
ncbi:hypothetical protein 2050HW_00324 [Serratia phage vB_SmaM_ 2050HW]|uniref:Uncharacterized protein n=1 Tax=Serratia phage vB_SmaM_ 2050HW TaxID=2024252 RepID=A0A289YZI9_9CAUD|nr:hypothetical protein HWB23_gp324 [Serratia phage vB_SmaM_ 2050HW]ATA65659.1 hypothetical protein 2050HW_00324 [Serratia phage vB_SmaM_ 2050HW]UCR74592.1 hypothetical protein [Serratia phage BUCT660]URG14160.1 hypothetical protein [Pectobacterium phage vB_ParM-25]